MLYSFYELGHAAVRPARAAADTYRMFLNHPFNPWAHTPAARGAMAACEVFERTTRRYPKPKFGIAETAVDDELVNVTTDVVWEKPFCRLLHFRRDIDGAKRESDPRVLLVAPMSGHFATLLRGTVESLLPDHEVFITDWTDARDVPAHAGRFDLDTYVDYMVEMMELFGGDIHIIAVCQPSVPCLAAVATMEMDEHPAVPSSLTMMGGPIDTRISPTVVNLLAEKRGLDWFKRNVISTVPWPHPGYGRRVYPGFLQLTGFMTMNLDRHLKAHKDLFLHLVEGDGDSVEKHRDFYDEYLAVMDLTAEFYLQTVEEVFIEHSLAKGTLKHRGRTLDLNAVRRVAVMTVEGEKDDITGRGQCSAALDLCGSLPKSMKQHYEQPGVGHYGIFNGSRFRSGILPRLATFMRNHDRHHKLRPPHPSEAALQDRSDDLPETLKSIPAEPAWGNAGMLDWFGLAPAAVRRSTTRVGTAYSPGNGANVATTSATSIGRRRRRR